MESVADSYDERSFFCLLFECGDDGFEGGERACSEVVSPGEAAGQQDDFCLRGNCCCCAIDEGWGVGGDFSECGEEVLFAVGAGESDDGAGDGGEHGQSVARARATETRFRLSDIGAKYHGRALQATRYGAWGVRGVFNPPQKPAASERVASSLFQARGNMANKFCGERLLRVTLLGSRLCFLTSTRSRNSLHLAGFFYP